MAKKKKKKSHIQVFSCAPATELEAKLSKSQKKVLKFLQVQNHNN
jgi:hypothetical protein